ncbi:hypothetical protein JCM10449v2_002889 [Rhodotorula kratochvilovae]
MPDPPRSSADPSSSAKDSWLDKGWPLTRFVGYRPPPPPPHQAAQTVGHHAAEKVLPAPLRERQRERRGSGGSRDGLRREDGTGADGVGEEQEEKHGPSLRKKAGEKLWDMFLTLIGCFGGIAFVALSSRSPAFSTRKAPLVVGSFGAEAVLLYAAHTSPLTQPRCVIFGNTLSAILGVCVAKLFLLLPGFTVGEVFGANWAAAACSLALSLAVMQVLEITHPPGGATALLATTLPQVAALGWWYVPQVLVSSLIMLAWALVVNNLGGRRYPTEWWWKSRWVVL